MVAGLSRAAAFDEASRGAAAGPSGGRHMSAGDDR
jgi:hypothetical protein